MTIPPAIDPRQLAAEIEASVAEFSRLVNLAGELGLQVIADLNLEAMSGQASSRPILAVQVLSSL